MIPARRVAAGAVVLLLVAGCSETAPEPDPVGPTQETLPVPRTVPGTVPGDDGRPSADERAIDPLVPARSATDLAERLVVAEDLVRDRGTAEERTGLAAFTTQLLYRKLARRPAWVPQVLAAVPVRYRATVRAHVTARTGLRSIVTTLSDELPPWEIIPSAPAEDLLAFYREGERTYGVAWEVLAAINLVETGLGKIRGLSTAGARGPMQFIPSTWAAYGEGDIDDPHDAILAAARYLAANGGDSPGSLDAALHAYNNHSGYVAGVRAYASVLEEDPRAFRGFYGWQVIYLSTIGDLWLPVGWHSKVTVPAKRYAASYPDRHLGTATD